MSPEENRALFESAFNDEEDSSSIFEKVSNASGILNKSKTLFGSILEIPTKAVVKALNKSEENMYNMVFGMDDKKENKWKALIKYNKKKYYLGNFENYEDAEKEILNKRRELGLSERREKDAKI